MKIYAYGIIDSNRGMDEPLRGLGEASVYNIPYRDIGIVVSESEQIQDITQEHILKHEEVVEKLMESFTVLPVSFLTLFKKKDDVLLMMQEHYGDFRENLDRLRNKVEFGIKIIWPGETIKNRVIEASKKFNPSTTLRIDGERSRTINANLAIPDNSPGKSFVMQKLEKYKIDKEFAEEADRCIVLLDDFFSRFVTEKKLEKLKSENLLLNAYYLVEKEKQGDFKEAFERAKNTPGDLKYLFSGPWPPYNFISLTKKPSSLDYLNTKDVFTKLLNNLDLTENKKIAFGDDF